MSAPPLVLNPVLQPPGNETPEHFLLKQVARVYLKVVTGCQIAGTEVGGMDDYSRDAKQHTVADAVGVKLSWEGGREKRYTVYCIEAKQSLSDFKSGFCQGGDLNYVIAPQGLLTPKLLPNGVGLVEVNFDRLAFTFDGIYGLTLARRATRQAKTWYPRHGNDHDTWARGVIEAIAAKETNDAVFRGLWFYPGFPPSKFNREAQQ